MKKGLILTGLRFNRGRIRISLKAPLHVTSTGADIHGWWVNATRKAIDGKTFLIAHGRSLPIPVYKEFIKQLVDKGHNVFIFDYRDFGKSSGFPTESNMNGDAEIALNYAANRQNISVRL